MEFNDVWNLKFSALWEPHKVEQLDSASVPFVFSDDEFEIPKDVSNYGFVCGNYTLTACLPTKRFNNSESTVQAHYHMNGDIDGHTAKDTITYRNNLIMPHIQFTFHGNERLRGAYALEDWLDSKNPEDISGFMHHIRNMDVDAMTVRLIHANGDIEQHFTGQKMAACDNSLGNYSDKFFHDFNAKVNPQPHSEWCDAITFPYREFMPCECNGESSGCTACLGTGCK